MNLLKWQRKNYKDMVNIGALLIGMLFGFAAQTMTFFQLQGSLKFEWFKNHYWLTVLMGIPISMLFMYSVKNMIIAFDGQLWPSRLIGFSIGAIVFTILSWTIFNEPLTTKTYVCLMLALGILMVQLFWK
jgi:multidrug transporter EmrE-like cation transporter